MYIKNGGPRPPANPKSGFVPGFAWICPGSSDYVFSRNVDRHGFSLIYWGIWRWHGTLDLPFCLENRLALCSNMFVVGFKLGSLKKPDLLLKKSQEIKKSRFRFWGVWGTILTVNVHKRVAQKLLRIVLLHCGLVTFRFRFGKNAKSHHFHDFQN